ncbi:hypothetical protein FQR65_LT20070 [Abscondita terminalis]|nr:hypothetical protein FQR65_LT20070 [Abscondita terminalis]
MTVGINEGWSETRDRVASLPNARCAARRGAGVIGDEATISDALAEFALTARAQLRCRGKPRWSRFRRLPVLLSVGDAPSCAPKIARSYWAGRWCGSLRAGESGRSGSPALEAIWLLLTGDRAWLGWDSARRYIFFLGSGTLPLSGVDRKPAAQVLGSPSHSSPPIGAALAGGDPEPCLGVHVSGFSVGVLMALVGWFWQRLGRGGERPYAPL